MEEEEEEEEREGQGVLGSLEGWESMCSEDVGERVL